MNTINFEIEQQNAANANAAIAAGGMALLNAVARAMEQLDSTTANVLLTFESKEDRLKYLANQWVPGFDPARNLVLRHAICESILLDEDFREISRIYDAKNALVNKVGKQMIK